MEKKTDFKALPNKAKAQYLWDYYRWPFIITVAIVSFIIYMAYHFVSYRDPLLNVIMINCNDPYSSTADGFNEFLAEYGYDPEVSDISISSTLRFYDGEYSTSYTDYQTLTVMIAAGGQDLFFGTGSMFTDCADQGTLIDLSTVLPAELLEQYQAPLLYSTDGGEVEPYPCAIELTNNSWLKKNNYYDTCYFGIFYQSQNPNTAAQFAEFLLSYDSE